MPLLHHEEHAESCKENPRFHLMKDGRFFTNISEQDAQHLIEKSTAISLVDMWSTDDKLNRDGFYWVNVIIKKT